MGSVSIQRTSGGLVAQQVEFAFSKVKERTDGWVGLSVIVSKVTLEVAAQRRNAPVGQ